MSVDIAVKFKDGKLEMLPVSGTFSFNNNWREPSRKLGLQVVPVMDSIITSDINFVLQLRDELLVLQEHSQKREDLQDKIKLELINRLNETINYVDYIIDNWEYIEHISCG